MKGPHGYGRYDDDPEHVGCPRARSDMTPCIARDGGTALADGTVFEEVPPSERSSIIYPMASLRPRTVPSSICVGCGAKPGALLKEIGHTPRSNQPTVAADELREQVRRLTEPAKEENQE